jgi:hypothetical protein
MIVSCPFHHLKSLDKDAASKTKLTSCRKGKKEKVIFRRQSSQEGKFNRVM